MDFSTLGEVGSYEELLEWLKGHWPLAVELALWFLLRLVLAIAIFVIGMRVAGWGGNRAGEAFERLPNWDKTLTPPTKRVVSFLLAGLTVCLVLILFGVQMTAFIAVLTGSAVAIGLAIQGTLSNVASGVMLLVLRPMRPGDFVRAGGTYGNVVEINLFFSTIRQLNGEIVSEPNSNVFSSAIKNYTMPPTRSLWDVVGISYDSDIDQARAIILDLLENDDRWLSDPAPVVYVTNLGEYSVDLTVSASCPTKVYFQAKSDFFEAVKKRFDAQGVTIPFPTSTLELSQADQQQAAARAPAVEGQAGAAGSSPGATIAKPKSSEQGDPSE